MSTCVLCRTILGASSCCSIACCLCMEKKTSSSSWSMSTCTLTSKLLCSHVRSAYKAEASTRHGSSQVSGMQTGHPLFSVMSTKKRDVVPKSMIESSSHVTLEVSHCPDTPLLFKAPSCSYCSSRLRDATVLARSREVAKELARSRPSSMVEIVAYWTIL